MLRGADSCSGCALGPVCPAPGHGGDATASPSPFPPLQGPVCARGFSPCIGGSLIPVSGAAICLSGSASPFGPVLDVLVSCGRNGTSSQWALCAGVAKTGCGGCVCTCRPDAELTAYANRVIGEGSLLGPNGVCLDSHFLPGSINPVNMLLSCRAC